MDETVDLTTLKGSYHQINMHLSIGHYLYKIYRERKVWEVLSNGNSD